MNGCFFSLKRKFKIKTTDNKDTETEDQRIIIVLNEITKQNSQLTEISTLLRMDESMIWKMKCPC